MDEGIELFIDAARAYAEVLVRAGELPLKDRLEALALASGQLYLSALQLPQVDDVQLPSRVPGAEPLGEWPGVGAFDEHWRIVRLRGGADLEPASVAEDLALIYAEIVSGLQLYDGDLRDAALIGVLWFRQGFDRRWGGILANLLPALHRGIASFRSDEPKPQGRRGPRVAELVELARDPSPVVAIVHAAPALPERLDRIDSGRRPISEKPLAQATPPRPKLGLRFESTEEGALITGVHPAGPAHGLLVVGDVLLAVDGVDLAGAPIEAVGARLLAGEGARIIELWRDGEVLVVELTPVAATLPDLVPSGPNSAGPPDSPPKNETVKLQILHPEAAARAGFALRMLGCDVHDEGAFWVVTLPPALPRHHADQLFAAGVQGEIWTITN